MYAQKANTNLIDYSEKIMINVRGTPLKKEMIECVNDLPDEILLTIRPLFHMLIGNTSAIETISYDDLTAEEQESLTKAEEAIERGEFIRFEDIDWDSEPQAEEN
jgi:hypothetical protein